MQPANPLSILNRGILHLARADGRNLTIIQLGVLLICYQDANEMDGPHTVRGLASALKVSKPYISRALDRVELWELVARAPDLLDRRSIIIKQTREGKKFMLDLQRIL